MRVTVRGGGVRPEPVALYVGEVSREVGDDSDLQVLDGARRRPRHRRRDDSGAVSRHDHPGRAGACRTADDSAEVPRIRDLVEAADERSLDGRELPRVAVRIRLAPGDDALVVGRPCRLGELALLMDAHAWPLAEPVEGRDGALARPHLEHLSTTAKRFAHSVPAVDEVARHRRGTSRTRGRRRARPNRPPRLRRVTDLPHRSRVYYAPRRAPPRGRRHGQAHAVDRRVLPGRTHRDLAELCQSPDSRPVVHDRKRRGRVEVVLERRLEWTRVAGGALLAAESVPHGSTPALRRRPSSPPRSRSACAIGRQEEDETASRPHVSSTSRNVVTFPSDFDIFSP